MNRAEWLAWKETDPDWQEREQRRAAKRERKVAWKRLYAKRPEVKERRRAYRERPEVKEHRHAYRRRPEVRERRRQEYARERAAAAKGGGE